MLKRLRKQVRRNLRKRRGLPFHCWLPFQAPSLPAIDPCRYPEVNFSIHMLTCHRDVQMALWCIYSFIHFAGIAPTIVIHDDGTLDDYDKEMLCRSLPRCSVVDRRAADERMAMALAAYPLCRKMRDDPDYPCGLKLFDPLLYATGEVFVLLDSDILFFRYPHELLASVEQMRPSFNSDYMNSYSKPHDELSRSLGIDVLEKVNAGMMVLTRNVYELEFMESFFRFYPELVNTGYFREQTLHAVLLSRVGAHRLGDVYQISRDRIGPDTVSHHYVNDGSRFMFHDVGVRTLVRRGFLTRAEG